jgi:hypothetical protein
MNIFSKLWQSFRRYQDNPGINLDPGPGDPDAAVQQAKTWVSSSVKAGPAKKEPKAK